jgi:hypothetical protein
VLVDLEETVINIKKGRHPVIPLLFPSGDQFVANDTKLKVGFKLLGFEIVPSVLEESEDFLLFSV